MSGHQQALLSPIATVTQQMSQVQLVEARTKADVQKNESQSKADAQRQELEPWATVR